MSVFEYVLILLAAICLSNFINRFIPAISTPIIQIALGALITLLPLGVLPLDPELFFVLFVAPLIFYNSMLADKKTMWAQRKPILNMGIILVFATVVVGGYFVNFLIPSIPLAIAFALIASLGPTDDVAVLSVSKRVNVPPKIMRILEGESIINDASGIVSFQFALGAVLTGSFSLINATVRFFVIALGGIVVGLLATWLKYSFVRWIRSLGMENVTLHLLLGIMTPFVIYLIAEALEVSGILAIFAAGIAHSFNRDKFNPETINLSIASESIWSVLAFTLEGLVFLILGTQLPKILITMEQNNYPISTWEIIIYVLLITLLFLVTRFVWSAVTIKKKTYDDPEHPVSKFRAGIIFSLSGARGAVTLASIMSIPLLLTNGEAFPERDLIILIASGVILVSLAITNFILPLCVEKKASIDKSAENDAYLEIIQNVIAELKSQATPDNEAATAIITGNYYSRSAELQRKQNNRPSVDRGDERKLRITVCEWEKENITGMLERSETDEYCAQHYLDILDRQINKLSQNRSHSMISIKRNIIRLIRQGRRTNGKNGDAELRTRFITLIEANNRYVLENLKQMSKTEDSPAIRKMITDYEFNQSMYQRRGQRGEVDKESIAAVASHGFQAERDNIQAMFEAGRISRESAREMRHNISLLEVQLKKDHPFD